MHKYKTRNRKKSRKYYGGGVNDQIQKTLFS